MDDELPSGWTLREGNGWIRASHEGPEEPEHVEAERDGEWWTIDVRWTALDGETIADGKMSYSEAKGRVVDEARRLARDTGGPGGYL